MIGNWLYVALGLDGHGPFYAFYSGSGSNMLRLAIVVSVIRAINCHEKGCWRLGFHHQGHIVCHKHRGRIA